MRWNAQYAAASLLFLVACGGCSLFGRKSADTQTGDLSTDTYASSAYAEPLSGPTDYDPYAPPEPTERSYPTVSETTMSAGSQYHTVAKQDTLFKLARIYYNDAARWKDIYEANRSEITDPNRIFVGQRLLIP